jgi:hypothetical protein
MAKATLELDLPQAYLAQVPDRDWLRVRASPTPRLKFSAPEGEIGVPLDLVRLPPKLPPKELADFVAYVMRRMPAGSAPLIVAPYLRADVRTELEGLGVCYLDGRGHLHLDLPPVLIHLEGPPPSARPSPSGLGSSGIKVIQTVLAEQGPLSVAALALRAQVSLGQAHKVLSKLEQLGLLRAKGTGPSLRREIVDRTRLLDWLSEQPAALKREPHLAIHVYARSFHELVHTVSARLEASGVDHAVTGPAGVSLFGVGPTSVPVVSLRIDPSAPLPKVAKVLDAETVSRGANVLLLRDTARVGLTESQVREKVRVAPGVRVYLDTLSERRGEEIAQQFREVVLGF